MSDICKHCGKRIVLVNAHSNGRTWYHQSSGSSFMDGAHIECHITAAEPRDAGVQYGPGCLMGGER